MSVEEAVQLSKLEEEFQVAGVFKRCLGASVTDYVTCGISLQTENWGRVEWAHDLSMADIQSRVSAAITFIRLNFESSAKESKEIFVTWGCNPVAVEFCSFVMSHRLCFARWLDFFLQNVLQPHNVV